MTDDIVKRLRNAFDGDEVPTKNIALRLAADEIERLRAALKNVAEDTFWIGERAARSAMQGRRKMTDWRPIETAPKEQVILVYDPTGEGLICTAEWDGWTGYNAAKKDVCWNEGWIASPAPSDPYERFPVRATHWMPLPEPPK